MPGKVRLKVVAGPMTGREFVFEEHDTFLFGRAPECHISLPDDSYISRHHFMLEINPPEVCLHDLGSLNGTGVNGVVYGGSNKKAEKGDQAHAEVQLKDGDQIYAGKTVFALAVEAPRDPSAQTRNEASRPDAPPNNPHEAATVVVGKVPWTFAGYEVEQELGRGAMGSVHLARRTSDGKQVAIKTLFARTALNELARQLFLREIDILRGLRHPNIVSYIDGTSSSDGFRLVMEYCNLGSVNDRLEARGPLSFDTATSILQQVLAGLAYAHSKGFVHRDIKPGNILLRGNKEAWQAKVSDFGLAKCFDKAGCSGMTATGSFGGTLHYMPCEQLTHYKYVKPVSDVWSLAASYYQMLTGTVPRETRPNQDPVSVILRGEIIPIQKRMPTLSAGVVHVVNCALSQDPARRYPSAVEFMSALEQAL